MEPRIMRTRKPINYYEPDEPPEDAYEFCEECRDFTFEYCSVHGGLLVVPDDKVPSNLVSTVPRAVLSAPKMFLYIDSSTIQDAGDGVFAKMTLPRGMRFGPYCGQRIKTTATDYCWQVERGGRALHAVDASDPARSNWMRYVNCARHSSEQNLIAYQYHGKIYYRTTKIIIRHSELLVFYGSEFAAKLNINLGRYNKKEPKRIYPPAINLGSETREAPTIDLGDATKFNSTELERAYAVGVINLEKYYLKEKFKPSGYQSESSIKEFLSLFEEVDKIITKKEQTDKTPRESNLDSNAAVNVDQEPILNISDNDDEQDPIIMNFINTTDDLDKDDEKVGKRPTESLNLSEAKENVDPNIAKSLWKCSQCNKVFGSRDSLRSHRRLHGGARKFNCTICSYKTDVKYYYKKHEQSHNKSNRAQKEEIPENVDQKDAQIQPVVKPHWQCDECQNVFSTRAHLRVHKRIHGGAHKFKCNICDYETDVKYYIERHVKANHQNKSTVFKCSRCTFSSHNDKVFKIHEDLHANKKAIRCDMCDYLCTSNRYLNAHILRVHVPSKRHQCALCTSAFNCAEYLRKHIKTVHLSKDD